MGDFLDIRLPNSLHMRGYGTKDSIGFFVEQDGFDGWEDAPDARRDTVDIPNGHGAFDQPNWLAPRDITIKGFAQARTVRELEAMRDQLTGCLADAAGKIVVEYRGRTTWATVRRGLSRPTFKSVGGTRYGTFEISLWARNPRKFGEVQVAGPGTSVTAFHYGNFSASPELLVTGVMPSGYRVNGPDGRQFVVSQALAAGQTHRIDMSTGWLYRNGVLQTGAVSSARIWTVPSGVRVTHTLVPVSGSGQLTVRTPDTYI